ncbi:MAG: 50S ribosomal protein L9 [Candidatus Oxydemutatoraceae bacterium WSBS_2016_MAG_OTU14]
MEIILLAKIEGLGKLGDIVKVKSGYGRNYLIPTQQAKFATESNKANFEQYKAELEAKQRQEMDAAAALRDELEGKFIRIKANVRPDGSIYGSVGNIEIIQAIEETYQHKFSKNQIRLPQGSFRKLGVFAVEVFLYADVYVQLQLEITAQQ